MADSKVIMFPDSGSYGQGRGIDPGLLALLNNNGGFGGNGCGWMWFMFLWLLFPAMFGGYGNGGFGNGFGGNGTGFLANMANNDAGRELLMQGIQGNRESINSLASMLNSDINSVQNAISVINKSICDVTAQTGMTALQVQNAIQTGDAALSRQICECCCENRLAIANQTNAIQAQNAASLSAIQAQAASNLSALQTQLSSQHTQDLLQNSQNMGEYRLAIERQTNQLGSAGDRNANATIAAIADLKSTMIQQFCDVEKRDMQNKITTQGDIITQLRGQIDNDRQTAQLYAAISPIQAKVNEIANKQPNTVPITWPNLTAVNNTPIVGGWGYQYGNTFWN